MQLNSEQIGFFRTNGYRWLNRTLGVSQTVIDLIYADAVCAMAYQLLGGELRQATVGGSAMGSQGSTWPGGPTDPALANEGARGVYCTLPYGDKPRQADACHTHGHPFQPGVVGLIDDAPDRIWFAVNCALGRLAFSPASPD